MDYELKGVIAFCLIVKIVAALSSEFSIVDVGGGGGSGGGSGGSSSDGGGGGREKFEKNFTREELPRSPSLTIRTGRSVILGEENQVADFDWSLDKISRISKDRNSQKVGKVRGNFRIDPCADIFEVMEHPVRWSKIKKTLHWLDRLLASNKTNLSHCFDGKELTWTKHGRKMKNSIYRKTRENWEKETRTWRNLENGKREKNPNYLIGNRARDLINSHNSNIYSERNKKSKKESEGGSKRKSKHKTRKNRFKYYGNNKGNKKRGKGKRKGKGKSSHKGVRFRINKDTTMHLNPISRSDKDSKNNEIRKEMMTSGVLFESEKTSNETKSKVECQSVRSNLRDFFVSSSQKCGHGENVDSTESKPRNWESRGSAKDGEVESYDVKKAKPDNWPHFVYHRVPSTNVLDPESKNQSHRRSAYVAISVASSNNSDDFHKKTK